MHLLYTILYHSKVNYVLRNISYLFKSTLPKNARLNPSGKLYLKTLGDIKFTLHTNQTSHITKELYWSGVENYEYTSIFKALIKNTNTFIDVGASIGYYSVLAGKVNPKITVYAFEPAKGSMIYLKKNIEQNQLSTHVRQELLALSNNTGQIEFYEVINPKYPNTHNLSGEHNMGTKKLKKASIYKVNTSTLDLYCKEQNIGKVDLIKIDTEGSENLILEGGTQTISAHKPIIICETLYNKIETQLEVIMKAQGYEFYNHVGGLQLQKVDSIQRDYDNGIRNCFFVHPSKLNLIKEFIA